MVKRILTVAIGILILALWVPPSWGMGANVVFKPGNGEASDKFTIEGSMFHPNEKVVINWRPSSARLAEVQADAQGNLTVEVQVPADAHPGPNMVILAGDQGSGVAQEFTVGGPAQEPKTEEDTETEEGDAGLEPWIYGAGGLALGLVLGMVVFRRKTA